MRRSPFVVLSLAAAFASARGQSLAERVVATDGAVQVVYPSRPGACGDGSSYISNVIGHGQHYVDDVVWTGRNGAERACTHGPARVVATVMSGEITRLHAYVGPIPSSSAATRTLTVDAREAASWLGDVITHGAPRVASEAMLPLMLADADAPWPLLLKVARDSNRPRDLHQSVMMWLSNGVAEHLGIADSDARESDDDQMRTQAVFTLTQRPKSESVAMLIELSRTATHPSARKAAIYWLGQSGDPRAVDVYAELLGLR